MAAKARAGTSPCQEPQNPQHRDDANLTLFRLKSPSTAECATVFGQLDTLSRNCRSKLSLALENKLGWGIPAKLIVVMVGSAMRKILFLLSILVVAGCRSTSPMSHNPSPMGLTDAIGVIEKLTMTQHRAWRPDYVDIKSQYILWGHGTRSSGRGTAIVLGNVAVGRSSSTTREVGERLYYEQIHGIVLMSWLRNTRQWYAVSVRNSDNDHAGYIFRTRNLESAKSFVDAMEAVAANYKKDPEVGLDIPKPRSHVIEKTESNNADTHTADETEGTKDVYTELIKLDELRERGILTDAEFDAEKSKLLEGN